MLRDFPTTPSAPFQVYWWRGHPSLQNGGEYREPNFGQQCQRTIAMNDQVRATGAVVEFIRQAKWKDFPSDAVDLAKRCVIDGLGVMFAGSTTRASAILRDYIRTGDGSEEATVIGQQVFRTSARSAALANGT